MEAHEKSQWEISAEMFEDVIRSIATGVPWSGSERNHVYFGGIQGGQFEDLSSVSGLDDVGDGRTFALLDFDRDGFLDVALSNMTAPRLRLLRNDIGQRVGDRNRFVALRFAGGNTTTASTKAWSARDGFGTSVTLELDGGGIVYREHQPEGGFLSQHSSTMLVGIGANDRVANLTVRWLSGKTLETRDVPAGMLVTVYENEKQSPTGEPFVLEEYGSSTFMTRAGSENFWKPRFLPKKERSSELRLRERSKHGLTLFTTMATWCVACVTEMPEFRALREAFGEDELALYAVPIDTNDTQDMLDDWASEQKPPYEILTGIDGRAVEELNAIQLRELRADAVPASFLTDATGKVLIARWGVPSISDVRFWLWLTESDAARTITNGADF